MVQGELKKAIDGNKPVKDLMQYNVYVTPILKFVAGMEGDPSVEAMANALAESIIGLFKAEVIRQQGPWKGVEDVEFATLNWVDWFNMRLLGPIGDIPPAECEAQYYAQAKVP